MLVPFIGRLRGRERCAQKEFRKRRSADYEAENAPIRCLFRNLIILLQNTMASLLYGNSADHAKNQRESFQYFFATESEPRALTFVAP